MVTPKQINDFLCDENYLAVTEAAREHRLLFITDLSETRVSAFLGWLFRPHEGHGLGDQAIRELLQNAWRQVHSGDWDGPEWEQMGYQDWSPAKVAMRSFRDLCIETEYRFGKGERASERNRPVDILLVSRSSRLLVLIENKFGSAVHNEQLKAYREQAQKSFPEYTIFRIYLDPNVENKPDDTPYWIPLRYQWLIELISARERSGLLSDKALHALLQVNDYLKQDSEGGIATSLEAQLGALVADHRDVLTEMRRLKALGRHGRLTATAEVIAPEAEILLTEYHQRCRLWDVVFEQMDHLPLLLQLRRALGKDIEVRKLNKRIQFRNPRWAEVHDGAVPADAAWSIRLAAWKSENGAGRYSVRSVIDFNPIELADRTVVPPFDDQQEAALRRAAGSLRTLGRKASPEDQWIRLREQDGLNVSEAAALVENEFARINAALNNEALLRNL